MDKLETLKKERNIVRNLIASYQVAYEFSLVSNFDSFDRLPGDVGLEDRIFDLQEYVRLLDSDILDIESEAYESASDLDYCRSREQAYQQLKTEL
jgi:hypothetical protein